MIDKCIRWAVFVAACSFVLPGCGADKASGIPSDANGGDAAKGGSSGSSGSTAPGGVGNDDNAGSGGDAGDEGPSGSAGEAGSDANDTGGGSTGGSGGWGGATATGGTTTTGGAAGTGGTAEPDGSSFGGVKVVAPSGTNVSSVAPPALATGTLPISPAISISGSSTEPTTLTFAIQGQFDPAAIKVVRATPGSGTTSDVVATIMGTTVTVVTSQDGTYVVTEAIKPPANCVEKSLTASVSAATNADLLQLQGVTRLTGNLTLTGTVSDLSPLACLTFVTGYLSADSATTLNSLSVPGLASANRVYVNNDAALVAISLPHLRSVASGDGYSIHLSNLPELTKVELSSLIETPSSISLSSLGATADAPLTFDFGSLTTVRGNLAIGTVYKLARLDGFSRLSFISDYIAIDGVPDLKDATGLTELRSVNRVYINNDALLSSIALNKLTAVASGDGYSIHLSSLPELTSVRFQSLVETPSTIVLSSVGATADGPLTVDFPSLSRVRGDLSLVSILAPTADGPLTLGYPALKKIDGNLTLGTVYKLANLSAFQPLTGVGGYISIDSDPDLKSAAGLLSVASANRVYINADAQLSVVDLSSLSTVASGDGYSIHLSNLPELTSLKVSSLVETPSSISLTSLGATADAPLTMDFGSLTTVRGNLAIGSVSRLETLDGFKKLQAITDYISVDTVPNLVDASGLSALTSVNRVYINADAALTTIDLSSLTTVASGDGYSIHLSNLPKLNSVKATSLTETPSAISLSTLGAQESGPLLIDFRSLARIRGDFTLTSVLAPTADGPLTMTLTALKAIDGNLTIGSVYKLLDLDAFKPLTRVGGYVSVDTVPDLKSAAGLSSLTTVNRIYFNSDAALTTLDLSALATVGSGDGYSIHLSNLPKLTSFKASSLVETPSSISFSALGDPVGSALAIDFGALTTVRGDLTLVSVHQLAALPGFAALKTITGSLVLASLETLASLGGLNALTTLTGNLQITTNPLLPTCEAKAFALRVKPTGSSGTTSVSGNKADGC